MAFQQPKGKRSPIKEGDKPLRNPGESLQTEISRLFNEELMGNYAVILFAIIFALLEWWRWYFNQPPQPVQVTIVAIVIIAFGGYRMYRVLKRMQPLELGLEGEKFVGQYLEDLRTKGCKIFHDIPGDGFNIDHVIVSSGGIFAVETKTFSKPVGHDAKVQFDDEKILVDGKDPDRDLVTQALAQGKWLKEYLSKSTGKQYPVRSIILFPGWYVEQTKPRRRNDLWVLSPKALPSFVENEYVALKSEEVALAAESLSMYVRAHP